MKKLLVLILSAVLAAAKVHIPSPVPPAQIFYIDLEPGECSASCLATFIKDEHFASFLARYTPSAANTAQRELYSILISNNPLKSTAAPEFKIAVLIPQKVIKSYSQIITGAIFAYALRRDLSVQIDLFYSGDESEAAITEELKKIRRAGHKSVIAAVTANGIAPLKEATDLSFFVPTTSKNAGLLAGKKADFAASDSAKSPASLTQTDTPQIASATQIASSTDAAPQTASQAAQASAPQIAAPLEQAPSNIIFGAIDYDAQIAKLFEKTSGKIAIFYDESPLAGHLTQKILDKSPAAYTKKITNDNTKFEQIFKNNSHYNNAAIFFNTPLVKTALLASQLRVYDRRPLTLLSTQINYSGALIALSQPKDRAKLLVANSIFPNDDALIAASEAFSSSIVFEWVAYASALGFDYLFSTQTSAAPLFFEPVRDGAVVYPVRLMRSTAAGFIIGDEQ